MFNKATRQSLYVSNHSGIWHLKEATAFTIYNYFHDVRNHISITEAFCSLTCLQRHMKISCVTVSVEMSHSVVWGNLWSQDCNISTKWRKTVFHRIPTKLLNSSRPYEPHHNPTDTTPIFELLGIKVVFEGRNIWMSIRSVIDRKSFAIMESAMKGASSKKEVYSSWKACFGLFWSVFESLKNPTLKYPGLKKKEPLTVMTCLCVTLALKGEMAAIIFSRPAACR